MSIKHALLGILAKEPKHGYELKREFDDALGEFWNLNVGQIYTTLERLQADGLVEYEAIAQSDRPDKKVYRITDSGLAEFHDWQSRAIKPEPRSLRDELFVKVLFMDDQDVGTIQRLLQAQQNVYLTQMMHLTNRKFEIEQATRAALDKARTKEERRTIERDRFTKMVLLDVALLHAEADIRWLRQCEARIKDVFDNGTTGVSDA
jgi:DNA-binding PadR family transcriptional regulator